ncbi:MAG: insulinase family protein [Pyrinomonadaceae bacterium]
MMFPQGHPYNWTTIGSLDDLTAASMDDVKAFFRQYYVPNNASLVIAGDFNPKQAKALVGKIFRQDSERRSYKSSESADAEIGQV